MAERIAGPMCSTRCGPGWIDDGTLCLARSYPPGPTQGSVEKSRERTPILEDCQTRMQFNLPKAHRRALELTCLAIRFFEEILHIVQRSSSQDEISRQLSKERLRFLSIYLHIYINRDLRKRKNLASDLSRQEIDVEIIQPISHILNVYRKIYAGLKKADFHYECEYKSRLWYEGCRSDDTEAWQHSIFGIPFGNIHICVDNIIDKIEDIESLAELIIHEASHKFGGTVDDKPKSIWNDAYKYGELPTAERLQKPQGGQMGSGTE